MAAVDRVLTMTPAEQLVLTLRTRVDARPYASGLGVQVDVPPDYALRFGARVRIVPEPLPKRVAVTVHVRAPTGSTRQRRLILPASADTLSYVLRFIALPLTDELQAELVDGWDQQELALD